MRSLIMVAVLGALLILPGSSAAETDVECRARCGADKELRDATCQPPGEDTDQARALCLQDNQEAFNSCIGGCPPPEPAGPPAEK